MSQFGAHDGDWEKELAEAVGDMSLMDFVDDPPPARKPTPEGDLRRGTVVALQGEDILIEIDHKTTGVLPAKQLEGEPIPEIGSTIEVTVVGFDAADGLAKLSRQNAIMAAAWDTLHKGQVVEGVVTGHNKGGLELRINGIDAFMPISQIDRNRVESDDLGGYSRMRMSCEVVEFNRSGKKLVVSRRSLLAAEEAEKRKELFKTLTEGRVVTGTVRTIMPYGAFVDIGGADGLLHVRDMGHARVEDPKEVVHEGQKLELKVLSIDRENERIGLGLKQTMADPWDGAENKWPVDSTVSGRTVKLMDFGAFVELEEGVDGLIPISEFTYQKRIAHPREMVSEGQVVEVRVISVDIERKRIGLSLKRVGDDPWVGASVRWPENSVVQGTVTRLAEFGAFVELAPGVEGLIHISEVSPNRVHNVGEVVEAGQEVQVKVLDVDEAQRRISLSVKQLAEMPDYTGMESDSATEGEPEKPKPKRKKPRKGGLDWKPF